MNKNQTQIDVISDGIKFNINDAKNTILQIKAYLSCIYELLLKCLDQLMKLTSDTNDESDFNNPHLETVITVINELIKELQIVSNAQYNGRNLIADTYSEQTKIIFRLSSNIGFCRTVNSKYNDLTLTLPLVSPHALNVKPFLYDFKNVFEN